MKAKLLLKQHHVLSEKAFLEMIVWQVPHPVSGSEHSFKYRLALVVEQHCVLRYDNESGKGDHKHIGNNEVDYKFTTTQQLIEDFMTDVKLWRIKHEHSND
ncbi:MAG: DUF6516 family protein [Bacteroidota bacterium]